MENILKITSNNERCFSIISCTCSSAIARLMVVFDLYFIGRLFESFAIFIILLVLEHIDLLFSWSCFSSLKNSEKDSSFPWIVMIHDILLCLFYCMKLQCLPIKWWSWSLSCEVAGLVWWKYFFSKAVWFFTLS